MTFTLNATVAEVTTTDAGNTLVRLEATAGEEVTNSFGALQSIYSNTEGTITRATIALIIEGTDPPLAEGDVVKFQGHFSAAVPVRQEAAP